MMKRWFFFALLAFLSLSGIATYYYGFYNHYVASRLTTLEIVLKVLPKAFDDLKIGHLSDLHCGIYNERKRELEEAIDLLMAQEPDVIFITGDVIDEHTEELRDKEAILRKLKAPEGIFVILGNHEYGSVHSYQGRDSVAERIAEIKRLEESLGWTVLLDEHRILERDGEQVAVIGVENYSTGPFPREGDLAKASEGTEGIPCRLLLSHDPSHWRAEVIHATLPIAVTFSGHTHGVQLFGTTLKGLHIPGYPEHHGHYQEGSFHLYVSSGLGNSRGWGRFFKKREVTLITLRKVT